MIIRGSVPFGRDPRLDDEGLPVSVPSRWRLEMTPDLEALVVAAYVFGDEYRVPAWPSPAGSSALGLS